MATQNKEKIVLPAKTAPLTNNDITTTIWLQFFEKLIVHIVALEARIKVLEEK